ncbi:MAG: efflux RND transporter periplasmic adaptor subunit [Fidelibacterota bacterium]
MKFLSKYKWHIISVVVIFIIGYFIGNLDDETAPTNQQDEQVIHDHEETQLWTCSMHPQIKLEEPGQCPICFMDLIPLEQSEGEENEYQISFSESAIKLAEIQTTTVKRGEATKKLHLAGELALNEQETVSITTDVAGRIEKLYVDFTGEKINPGDPLYKFYSPDLYAIQEELLHQKQIFERTNKQTYSKIVATIREKLSLLGLTEKQIDEIENSGKARENITIYAKHSGTVVRKNVNEGDYVKRGTLLFEISDLQTLWLQLDAYERQVNWLKPGQSVTFSVKSRPGKEYPGNIDFIQPVLDPATQSSQVRVVVVSHDSQLKPGLFAKATIHTPINRAGELASAPLMNYADLPLLIPSSAPLLTGKRAVVFVEHQKDEKVTFEAREIILGPKVGKHYVVLSGLEEGEKVVTAGNFKIDSALQLEGKFSMMSVQDEKQKPSTNHSAVFIPVYSEYFNLQEALANDDFAMSKMHYRKLYEIIENLAVNHNELSQDKLLKWKSVKDNILNNYQPELTAIEKLRSNFEIISDNLIELAKSFEQVGDLKFNEAYCPMAFGNKGAYWLQKENQIANPYFGAKMLRCGEIKTNFGE